jgi:hypothetical protein
MNTRTASKALAVVLLLVVPQFHGQPIWAQDPAEAGAAEPFRIAVTKYVSMHRQFERYLPPPIDFTDRREAERSMREMAEALRRARRFVGEGNIFLGEIAISIRGALASAVRNADPECQRALGDVLAVPQLSVWSETVNDAFPWAMSRMLPPCIEDALPELPVELQYRVVGADLVLVDLHANLIVDILRDALPEFTR